MSTTGSSEETSQSKLGTYLRTHTNPPVFLISVTVIVAFLVAGVAFTDQTNTAASGALNFISTYLGWFYILAATFFLIFVIALMISRYGKLRLGPDDSEPEYRTFPWFAMLFTAGMGIGLVFFGVYEPAFQLLNAPIDSEGQQRASEAMNYTFYHWGLQPWAIYIVVGLAMGYFCFRKGLPLRPASAFYPLIKDRIYGWPGNLIDVLAVFGTLFGLATSLGLGALQVNAGLAEVFGLPISTFAQVVIITLITAIAIVSLMLGIDKGIRRLSVINLGLAFLLMVIIFAAGPKLFILTGLADSTGYYLQNLIGTSFQVFDGQLHPEAAAWQAGWTLFYWGWWISWSPFVGMFIARISYGRTIRQFIAGTLLAPVGVSIVWFSVLGGSGLYYQQGSGLFDSQEAQPAVQVDIANELPEQALFTLLEALPIGGVFAAAVALLTIVVVTLFFATSSDSGSLVVDMLTNGGDPRPNKIQRLFWAITEGAVAAVLLVVGGQLALTALQAASITAGLPFAVVLLLMCVGLLRAMREEPGLAGGAGPIGFGGRPTPVAVTHYRPTAREGGQQSPAEHDASTTD